MKYQEVGFRGILHRFVLVTLDEGLRKGFGDFPGIAEANCVLTYGYCDREAGLSLEVLAAAIHNEQGFRYANGKKEVTAKLRIGRVESLELAVCPDTDGKLAQAFSEKLEMLKGYDAPKEVEDSRKMQFLDALRDPTYIDDVRVRLLKEGMQTEECWVRITGLGEFFYEGTLLNQPYQDLGLSEGDPLDFFVYRAEDGQTICYADLDAIPEETSEDLKNGTALRKAISRIREKKSDTNAELLRALKVLAHSNVWIPCQTILSPADEEKFQAMKKEYEERGESTVGMKYQPTEEIRLVPSFMKMGEEVYMPLFTSEGEMGERGDEFTKVQKPFADALLLAQEKKQELTGIVVDPFSEVFLLPKKLYATVARLVIRDRKKKMSS